MVSMGVGLVAGDVVPLVGSCGPLVLSCSIISSILESDKSKVRLRAVDFRSLW
jgi:hypothetical protein